MLFAFVCLRGCFFLFFSNDAAWKFGAEAGKVGNLLTTPSTSAGRLLAKAGGRVFNDSLSAVGRGLHRYSLFSTSSHEI